LERSVHFQFQSQFQEVDLCRTAGVLLSTLQNPTSFNNFTYGGSSLYVTPFSKQSGEGAFCLPLNFAALGLADVKDGANVTIQVVFDGGDGKLYQVSLDCVFLSIFMLIEPYVTYSAQTSHFRRAQRAPPARACRAQRRRMFQPPAPSPARLLPQPRRPRRPALQSAPARLPVPARLLVPAQLPVLGQVSVQLVPLQLALPEQSVLGSVRSWVLLAFFLLRSKRNKPKNGVVNAIVFSEQKCSTSTNPFMLFFSCDKLARSRRRFYR
jgi:hypothetical protein